MNSLQELKQIADNQKTVRTTRLQKITKEIENMYINQGNKIKRQRDRLRKLEGKQ
ncbi:hypothetical protein ACDX78_13615 [Virgibacillus oceani]